MSTVNAEVVLKAEKALELSCEYCGTIFKTKSALNFHKKSAKYCILKREEPVESEFSCQYCDKKFTRKSQMNSHQNSCEFKSVVNVIGNYKQQVTEKNFEIHTLEKLLESKDDLIVKYEAKIKELENSISKIAVKASMKPTTTTKNKTVINNLQSFSYNDLKGCSEKLTIDTIKKGPQGHVELILPFIQGKVECTDFSRKTLKHKSKKGKVVTDPEGFKLIKKYSQAIESKNDELTKEYKAEIESALKTSEPLETTVLVDKSYKADVLNSEIKKTAKGEPTDFSAIISKSISLATVNPEVEVSLESSEESSLSEDTDEDDPDLDVSEKE